jgi:hypothetical protein
MKRTAHLRVPIIPKLGREPDDCRFAHIGFLREFAGGHKSCLVVISVDVLGNPFLAFGKPG